MRRRLRQAAARLGTAFAGVTRWSAEDYAALEQPCDNVEDHWAAQLSYDVVRPDAIAVVDRLGVATVHEGRAEVASVDARRSEVVTAPAPRSPVQLPLEPIEFAQPNGELPFESTGKNDLLAFDWFDLAREQPIEPAPEQLIDLDLPGFNPDATTARPASDVFDRPHAFRSDTLAGLLARETAIASPEGRARAARVFGDALDEGRWPKLYQSWMRLAPEVDCPRVLALTFEVRELWEESPQLWLRRSAPNGAGSYLESGRGQLSWRRALAMARAAPHQNAAMLLDNDFIGEWNELSSPCPGFWNFADYLELRATGDEAEADVLAILARFGRERRGLRHQEGCAHLDFTRPGWVLSIAGTIETGSSAIRTISPDEESAPVTSDEDE